MQQLLSLAVLLGAVLQLQGCGGDTATTPAPATDAPTTPAPVADKVYTGSFTMAGFEGTVEQANTPAMKAAIGEGLATAAGVPASQVEITSISAARRLEGRRLAISLAVDYTITIPGAGGAAAQGTVATALATKLADPDTFAADAFTAIAAAIAASPDIPDDVKALAAAATLGGFTAPVETTPVEGNSTRRLSFSFVTSDEPLIL